MRKLLAVFILFAFTAISANAGIIRTTAKGLKKVVPVATEVAVKTVRVATKVTVKTGKTVYKVAY